LQQIDVLAFAHHIGLNNFVHIFRPHQIEQTHPNGNTISYLLIN